MKTKRFVRWYGFAAAILIAVGMMACGDDGTAPTGGGGGGGGGGDKTPPGLDSLLAVDALHVDVYFNETLDKTRAERRSNYALFLLSVPHPTGGIDPLVIQSAVLDPTGRIVHLSLDDFMVMGTYSFACDGLADEAGNVITAPLVSSFQGSTAADVTPPTIVSRTPGPGATNVGVLQPVVVQFSEPMDYTRVVAAATWTAGGSPVPFSTNSDGGAIIIFTPAASLGNSTTCTFGIGAGAQDWWGNALAPTNWSYQTTSSVDNMPPTVTSTTPANGAVGVSTSTNLVLRFSEPVNPATLNEIFVQPPISDGLLQWAPDNRSFTFDPDVDLMSSTQYTMLAIPGAVLDFAGNGLVGPVSVVFSTGGSIANGRIVGTVIGMPSTPAANPAGAVVVATTNPPFTDDPIIVGAGVAGGGGGYSVQNLVDDTYYLISVLDSNDDGKIEIDTGDAIGVYGIVNFMTDSPDSVTIAGGGTVGNVNINLLDPTGISGIATYEGTAYRDGFYPLYVGVFDTTSFDPTAMPDYGWYGTWPFDVEFSFNGLDDGLLPGTYYVAAFIDVGFDGGYDPGTDPAGFYGTPTPITLANGEDALGLIVRTYDPGTLARSLPSGAWKGAAKNERTAALMRWAAAAVREATVSTRQNR